MASFVLMKDGADHVAGDTTCKACSAGYPRKCHCKFGFVHGEDDVTLCDYCGVGMVQPTMEPEVVAGVEPIPEAEPETCVAQEEVKPTETVAPAETAAPETPVPEKAEQVTPSAPKAKKPKPKKKAAKPKKKAPAKKKAASKKGKKAGKKKARK